MTPSLSASMQDRPARSASREQLPALVGLGTAVPALQFSQTEMAANMASLWNLNGRSLQRWHGICQGAGIDFRHGVVPPDEAASLSTAERMRLYERCAPELAYEAASNALRDARIDPTSITDLIVVSCTGFSAPGVDVALCDSLGLSRNVRRSAIGFMGCFGAITGLRAAIGACSADSQGAALVVCIELCTLHARNDSSMDNQVASALFADGAAAAVIVGSGSIDAALHDRSGLGRLCLGRSCLLPRGRNWMTWRVTDAGFAMTLGREVPAALYGTIEQFIDEAGQSRPRTYIVHPGGPGILDAVDHALHLKGQSGLQCAFQVLCRHGNMSSATVLFVLQEALRQKLPRPALLLAFGPGLTIESMRLM